MKSDSIIEAAEDDKAEDCEICKLIIKGCCTPLKDRSDADPGQVAHVLSTDCPVHQPLIQFLLQDWNRDASAGHQLTYVKLWDESCLIFSARKEAESRFEEARLCELIHEDGGLSRFGRGRILDNNFVRLDTLREWCRMCPEFHGDDCVFPEHARGLDANPAYFVDTHHDCIVPAHPDMDYFALSYVW